ncbi:MAG: hypothetical protein NC218_08860 [Acetobacter sp.]|nr:hypothetical protein [Acetobacter sp.]
MKNSNLLDYLYDCRWCSFKEDIRNNAVCDVVLEKKTFDDGRKLFVLGQALGADGKPRFFSMPLQRKGAIPQDGKFVVLNGEIYTDALLEPDFWQSWNRLIAENDGFVRFDNGWTLEAVSFSEETVVADNADEYSKPLGVEQSNTTLNVGGKIAFKLERMIEFSDDINSEFEMNQKLMREGCRVMPKTYSGYVWRQPNGQQAAAGIVQEFVPNRGDLWNYALNYLEEKLKDGYLHQRVLKAEDNQSFMRVVRNLSEKTREMGECLSRMDENPNFMPEDVNDGFIRGYGKQMDVLLYKTQRAIALNLDRLPEPTRSQAAELLKNWNELTSDFVGRRMSQIRMMENKGTINRVHGDFHLGQVMVTKDEDLRFIDFAGEPDLPMEQRKQKHIFVRDVAGMYRSIKGYLGAVAVENFAASAPSAEVAAERKVWAGKAIKPLIDSASRAFLGEKKVNDPWLSLEILRKNLYEVNYEVNNRPQMAYVPISGLSELLVPPSAANMNIKSIDNSNVI